jgi:CubicO group peptidase (beta-lactamase class C family)
MNNPTRHATFFLALAVLLAAVAPSGAQRASGPPTGTGAPAEVMAALDLPGLDAHVASVMDAFEVPGLAVAVVKDGRVVVARGYGVRTLGEAATVDGRTLFGIASNTKAFTATALGLLVEEGKLAWDEPVVTYLPWFRMSDPYVTQELTVRDLLVHRSGLGLGAGDLLWWPPSTYDRKEIVRRLRHVPLATSFRSAYAYDNVLYTVAGEVIEAVSGQSWEDFVQTRLLEPLGMRDSDPRHSRAEGGGNVAGTHARIDGVVRLIDAFASDNTNPAGGIMSSAEDMARWLVAQLDSGRVANARRAAGGAAADGERLWSERTARELWTLVTPIPIGSPPPELRAQRATFNGYGLGFYVRDYRGQKMLIHSGYVPGYISRVIMLPDLKLGVVVLTNHESPAMDPIAWWVVDHYTGGQSTDWVPAYRTAVARSDSITAARDAAAAAARDSLSGPSLAHESYLGTYRDPWYGNVLIEPGASAGAGAGASASASASATTGASAGASATPSATPGASLRIRFAHSPSLVGDLVHWQHDTFKAVWDDRELRADAFVTFWLGPDGSIREVRLEPASPSVDFSFDFQDLRLAPVR